MWQKNDVSAYIATPNFPQDEAVFGHSVSLYYNKYDFRNGLTGFHTV